MKLLFFKSKWYEIEDFMDTLTKKIRKGLSQDEQLSILSDFKKENSMFWQAHL